MIRVYILSSNFSLFDLHPLPSSSRSGPRPLTPAAARFRPLGAAASTAALPLVMCGTLRQRLTCAAAPGWSEEVRREGREGPEPGGALRLQEGRSAGKCELWLRCNAGRCNAGVRPGCYTGRRTGTVLGHNPNFRRIKRIKKMRQLNTVAETNWSIRSAPI